MTQSRPRPKVPTGRQLTALAVLVLAWTAALPQQSESFDLSEVVVGGAAAPDDGVTLLSASMQISLAIVGGSSESATMLSPSFSLTEGLVISNAPPGETIGMTFLSPTELAWDVEPTAGFYNLYRDDLSSLPGAFGACLQSAIPTNAWTDSSAPLPGQVYFFLVTTENRLGEEGTMGSMSDGTVRLNAVPCP